MGWELAALACLATGGAIAHAADCERLHWDNNDTNGVNGISHHANEYERSVLDDFVVPEGIWTLTRFTTIGITGGPGKLLGFDLTVWSNDPDARKGEEGPGAPIVSMEVTSFTSELTGRFWFFDDRPEMKVTVTFEPVELPPGRYWLEMNLHFSRNWFQMAKDGDLIRDNPMWLLYLDFGDSPIPGREIFRVDYDVSWTLSGTTPESITPISFSYRGVLVDGDLADLAASDDAHVIIRNIPPPSLLDPAIELEIEGRTGFDCPRGIELTVEAASTAIPPIILQTIELFDFEAAAWVLYNQRLATLTDSVVTVRVGAGATRYIEAGTGRLRARVRWFNSGTVIGVDWRALIDQTVWVVGP